MLAPQSLLFLIKKKKKCSWYVICYTCAPCYFRLITESVIGYNYEKLPSMFANYEECKYEYLSFQATDSAWPSKTCKAKSLWRLRTISTQFQWDTYLSVDISVWMCRMCFSFSQSGEILNPALGFILVVLLRGEVVCWLA